MADSIRIEKIEPTVFLKGRAGRLERRVDLTLANAGGERPASVLIDGHETRLGRIAAGESRHEVLIKEVPEPADVTFTLRSGGVALDTRTVRVGPARHWVVHVVHLSHHDVGYTNLPSRVLAEHDRWLDEAITMADETARFPDDAKFRLVIEQAWSLDHFVRHAPEKRVARLVELLRSGRFEMTALFGNMTTEICGHESLIRCLYHAFRLKRRYGIPLLSAQHNDVPGMSWGLSEVLAGAGIKLFCPRLPRYYNWGQLGLQSFWDEKKIYARGDPGAFWWETPSGARVLLWSGNRDCHGGAHATLPGLAGRLREMDAEGYPYPVVRCVVQGGWRDNSPYIAGFAHTIRRWNSEWAWPHLVCSTDAKFYKDLLRELPDDLPAFRGELPGQDYPVGALSTAAGTVVNRRNHAALAAAEQLAAAAADLTDYDASSDDLFGAWTDVLWYDEHTWGHHFPCGPTCTASEIEKSVHAHRAAAGAHDVTNRAMARIADNLALAADGLHLVIFNPTGTERTGPARFPLREIENCGSTMRAVPPEEDPAGIGYLRGVALQDRWHAHPTEDLVAGRFDLIDVATGAAVPFQLVEIESAMDTVPYAAQRCGLGSGTRRYGFFDVATGLKRDLCFLAAAVPPHGYRAWRLVPRKAAPRFRAGVKQTASVLDNAHYRLMVDRRRGCVSSIVDKASGRELVDRDCPHGFGAVVVRDPQEAGERVLRGATVRKGPAGPVLASLALSGAMPGHPEVRQTITLHADTPRIDVAVRILRDATPLLDTHVAFPFRARQPKFRYEGALSVMAPIHDYLPKSYSDRLAVQNWVQMRDGRFSVLWSSLDAPIASLAGLWPGYVSPAHRCLVGDGVKHPPLRPGDLKKGWIYSNVFSSNFGTNFSVSQVADVLFRYSFTTRTGRVSESDAATFGWECAMPLEGIFTCGPRSGVLPVCGSFFSIDHPAIVPLAFKPAEDGRGRVLRLWNVSGRRVRATVTMACMTVARVTPMNLAEEDTGRAITGRGDQFEIEAAPRQILTFRIVPSGRAVPALLRGEHK